MTEPYDIIADTLRGRILRAMQAGTLNRGDRLPSARDLATEFDVDHRVVLAAYRKLSSEELVEMRERGGIYIAADHAANGNVPLLPQNWIVEILGQGLIREIPVPDISEWIRRCTETLRLRAAVITTTIDQAYGICRELRDDFGLDADGVLSADLTAEASYPLAIRRADMLMTTRAHEDTARRIGDDLKKPVIVIEIRPDVIIGDWILLLRQPVYAIVATSAFGEMLRSFFASVPGATNLKIMVLGQDDLSTIPVDAPTYVNQSVRAQLGGASVPGRILPAARTISGDTAQLILELIVRFNAEAMRSLGR